jgi:hypothetical protein
VVAALIASAQKIRSVWTNDEVPVGNGTLRPTTCGPLNQGAMLLGYNASTLRNSSTPGHSLNRVMGRRSGRTRSS